MNILNRSCLKTKNGLLYLAVSEWEKIEWICHAFLTRNGGASPAPFHSLDFGTATGGLEKHLFENKKKVASAFHFEPDRLVLLHQKHRDRTLVLKEPTEDPPSPLEYDAVITRWPNRFLGIRTADCLPILVLDRVKKVIAAIHAGREGTALQITRKVLRRMEAEFGCIPENLSISLGPSIGVCCYEIDEKVFVPEWEPFAVPEGEGKWRIDLARINIAQMKREGIREDQISRVDLCTRCHPDLFFSYRGEGRTGRQLSFVGIRATDSECHPGIAK